MKGTFVLILLCAVTALAVVGVVTLGRRFAPGTVKPAAQRTFQVRGTVRGLDADGKTIRIAHEEVPGYMPAMTMPFTASDPRLLRGLAKGDTVAFQLVVTENDSWVDRIDRIDEGGSGSASRAAAPSAARELERVQIGEVVPDFELVDQNGGPIHLGDFKGQAVLLTFIYTRCPIPNFCPLTSKNFAELQKRLGKEFPDRFKLLSVSIDPAFDKPDVLKHYGARYEADERHWRLGTGSPEQTDRVADLMGLMREPENGFISHDLRTALIGPDGRLVHVWKSNVWTPYEVQRLVRETLTGNRDVAVR